MKRFTVTEWIERPQAVSGKNNQETKGKYSNIRQYIESKFATEETRDKLDIETAYSVWC